SADPAAPAAHVGAVARRIVLVELDVGDEPRSRIASLEQVVTQDAVLRKPALEHALEHFDVVDALADERTLAETVLIDVREGSRVRIDPRRSAENARENCSVGPGETRHHARLQDPVSRRDATFPGVVA